MTRRRLDAELVRRKLADTRSAANRLITEGRVKVGGVVDPKPATMVSPEVPVEIIGPPPRFVGRGGDKLAHALAMFSVDPSGRRAVDLGSSTGGFTDCLLQNGAAHVTAVDVGTNQLDYRLRTDDRVSVHEQTNARSLDPAGIGGPFDIVVADLSFISLELVMATIAALAGPGADIVVLVKPQFEVGKGEVGRGGLVTDPALWRSSIERVTASAARHGLGAHGIAPSPLPGAVAGNREFLVWLRHGPGTLRPGDVDDAIANSGEEAPA
ncbi:MAG: TlyA family RNA methyltransferase [Acidimicrobiia bacterium]|nr:TlyA family RNA methyltransferase [Acidimicrobiia bacterium]NNL69091.1 TlyA family RNA methyltransferase [Acidimicrobiia bacterium]